MKEAERLIHSADMAANRIHIALNRAIEHGADFLVTSKNALEALGASETPGLTKYYEAIDSLNLAKKQAMEACELVTKEVEDATGMHVMNGGGK